MINESSLLSLITRNVIMETLVVVISTRYARACPLNCLQMQWLPTNLWKNLFQQDGIERRYKLVVDEARNLQNKLKTENSQMTEKTKQQLNDIVQGTINDANALKQQLQTTKKN